MEEGFKRSFGNIDLYFFQVMTFSLPLTYKLIYDKAYSHSPQAKNLTPAYRQQISPARSDVCI